jgi:hypothetical protein
MYFVFDIESIPDFDLLRELLDNPDPDDNIILDLACEELTSGKTGFLPPMYHRMVSWVGLWIDNLGNPKQKAAWTGVDEKQGLLEEEWVVEGSRPRKYYRLTEAGRHARDVLHSQWDEMAAVLSALLAKTPGPERRSSLRVKKEAVR